MTWNVRVVDNLDSHTIGEAAGFLQSFLPEGADPLWSAAHFRWKLGEANPAGPGFMTVAVHKGDVIGVTTITRKRMWDGQREVAAAEIGDSYSHLDFRRKGQADLPYPPNGDPDEYLSRSVLGRLTVETRARAEQAGISLIYATPNENSMPGFVNRLGFFHYQSHYNQAFVRPVASTIVSRGPKLHRVKGLLHSLDRGFAKACRGYWARRGRFQAQENRATDKEIDKLWLRLRSGVRFGVLRDSAYFRHRFLENPLADYRLWTVTRDGSVCGVFVTRVLMNQTGDQSCYLADWLLDQSYPGIFNFAVAHMVAEQGDPNTKTYRFWAERQWVQTQGLLPLGCIGRSRVPIIFLDNQASRALEATSPKLDFTLATSDNI